MLSSLQTRLQVGLYIQLIHAQTLKKDVLTRGRKKEVQLWSNRHRHQKSRLGRGNESVLDETLVQQDNNIGLLEVHGFPGLHPPTSITVVTPIYQRHDLLQNLFKFCIKKKGMKEIPEPLSKHYRIPRLNLD